MSILSRALLILALLAASTLARSDGIYNPAIGRWGSDGISNAAATSFPVGCGLATTGALDLSVCSNTIYVAIGIL